MSYVGTKPVAIHVTVDGTVQDAQHDDLLIDLVDRVGLSTQA
jgi:hypothetical protein